MKSTFNLPGKCRFEKGSWSSCDPQVQLKQRTDSLKEAQSTGECPRQRTITKRCKKKHAKTGT